MSKKLCDDDDTVSTTAEAFICIVSIIVPFYISNFGVYKSWPDLECSDRFKYTNHAILLLFLTYFFFHFPTISK